MRKSNVVRLGMASVALLAMTWTAGAGQAIQWPKAPRMGRRRQARIVQTTQAGRWGQVRTLHRLLTHACSAKMLAGKRVTDNQGKRTPGVANCHAQVHRQGLTVVKPRPPQGVGTA